MLCEKLWENSVSPRASLFLKWIHFSEVLSAVPAPANVTHRREYPFRQASCVKGTHGSTEFSQEWSIVWISANGSPQCHLSHFLVSRNQGVVVFKLPSALASQTAGLCCSIKKKKDIYAQKKKKKKKKRTVFFNKCTGPFSSRQHPASIPTAHGGGVQSFHCTVRETGSEKRSELSWWTKQELSSIGHSLPVLADYGIQAAQCFQQIQHFAVLLGASSTWVSDKITAL